MPKGSPGKPRLSLSLSRSSSSRSSASSSPDRVDPDLLPYHQRSSGDLLADSRHAAKISTVTSAAGGMRPALSKASSAPVASTNLSSSDNEHFDMDMLSHDERAAVLKDHSEKLQESSTTRAPRARRISRGLLLCFGAARKREEDDDASHPDSAPPARRMSWATAWAASKPPPKTCVQAAAETLRPDLPSKFDKTAVGKQPRPMKTKDEAMQCLSDCVGDLRKRNILKRDTRMWMKINDLPPLRREPLPPLHEGSQVAPRPGGWSGAGAGWERRGGASHVHVHVGSDAARP